MGPLPVMGTLRKRAPGALGEPSLGARRKLCAISGAGGETKPAGAAPAPAAAPDRDEKAGLRAARTRSHRVRPGRQCGLLSSF